MEEINVNQEEVTEAVKAISDSKFDSDALVGTGLILLSGVGVYCIGKLVINKGIKPLIAKCREAKKSKEAVSCDEVAEAEIVD